MKEKKIFILVPAKNKQIWRKILFIRGFKEDDLKKKKTLKNLASIEVAIRDERKSVKEVDLRKSMEHGSGLASNGSGLWLLS